AKQEGKEPQQQDCSEHVAGCSPSRGEIEVKRIHPDVSALQQAKAKCERGSDGKSIAGELVGSTGRDGENLANDDLDSDQERCGKEEDATGPGANATYVPDPTEQPIKKSAGNALQGASVALQPCHATPPKIMKTLRHPSRSSDPTPTSLWAPAIRSHFPRSRSTPRRISVRTAGPNVEPQIRALSAAAPSRRHRPD